jgi:hypothetical protein
MTRRTGQGARWDRSCEARKIPESRAMANDGGMLASDRDRENTVQRLRDAFVSGRLQLCEVQDRAGAAYLARTRDELSRLIADLPGPGVTRPQAGAGRLCHPAAGRAQPGHCLSLVLLIVLASVAAASATLRPVAAPALLIMSLTALAAACCNAWQDDLARTAWSRHKADQAEPREPGAAPPPRRIHARSRAGCPHAGFPAISRCALSQVPVNRNRPAGPATHRRRGACRAR